MTAAAFVCSVRAPQGGQAPLALPHVSVIDITAVDWHSLRAAGFVGCVFDKVRGALCRASSSAADARSAAQDNTLTAPYGREVYPPLRAALAECLEAFSGRAVLLRCAKGTHANASRRPGLTPTRAYNAATLRGWRSMTPRAPRPTR